MDSPISVRKTTEEEVEALSVKGPGQYKWSFPVETFDGTWWAIEVPNNKVASAINSFRNQCESVYQTRAKARKGSNGEVFVKRLLDKPVSPRPKRGSAKS